MIQYTDFIAGRWFYNLLYCDQKPFKEEKYVEIHWTFDTISFA